MSRQAPAFDPESPVAKTAGAWLARRDRGLTEDEQHSFESWLAEDPAHAAAVAKIEAAMRSFDRLLPLVGNGRPDPELFSRPPRRRRTWIAGVTVAMAASLAVGLFLSHRHSTSPSPNHFQTAPDGYQRATLPDGSTLELNAASSVELAFSGTERRVHLRNGEAHFNVAPVAVQPFVVSADFAEIRVLGTAFSVRRVPEGVEILVTEGRVLVNSTRHEGAAPTLVTAGHRLSLDGRRSHASAPAPVAVTAVEIENALSWQPRLLDLSRTPLASVVSELNRVNHIQIVISDPSLLAMEIGGNIRADQVEAFIRLLEQSFDVASRRSGQTIFLERAR